MALCALSAAQSGYQLSSGSPSGGVAYGLNQDGTYSSIPYAMSENGYGAGNRGGESSSCSGQTTWAWIWTG